MKNQRVLYCFAFLILLLCSCSNQQVNRVSLAGNWQFKIDANDEGVDEKWFQTDLDEQVLLPGSMKENGKGYLPSLKTIWTGSIYDSSFFFNPKMEKYRHEGNIKFPFWLTPNLCYKGAAWYRKEVFIPEEWSGQRITLHLERPHWQTSVWVDNQFVGDKNSLSVSHDFDITDQVSSGSHYITVRVDNRLDKVNVGPDSHSVSDHTQGNWNGIVGQLYIEATPTIFIDDIQLFPDVQNKLVRAVVTIKNASTLNAKGILDLLASSLSVGSEAILNPITTGFVIDEQVQTLEIEYPMGDEIMLWDEFHPNLYSLKATLKTSATEPYVRKVTFGMRDFRVVDGRFEINKRPVFLRGTVECNTFPLAVSIKDNKIKALILVYLNHMFIVP